MIFYDFSIFGCIYNPCVLIHLPRDLEKTIQLMFGSKSAYSVFYAICSFVFYAIYSNFFSYSVLYTFSYFLIFLHDFLRSTMVYQQLLSIFYVDPLILMYVNSVIRKCGCSVFWIIEFNNGAGPSFPCRSSTTFVLWPPWTSNWIVVYSSLSYSFLIGKPTSLIYTL